MTQQQIEAIEGVGSSVNEFASYLTKKMDYAAKQGFLVKTCNDGVYSVNNDMLDIELDLTRSGFFKVYNKAPSIADVRKTTISWTKAVEKAQEGLMPKVLVKINQILCAVGIAC